MPSLHDGVALQYFTLGPAHGTGSVVGTGMIDTGAHQTTVDLNLIHALGIPPTGLGSGMPVDGRIQYDYVYRVSLNLHSAGFIPAIDVLAVPHLRANIGVDALIGRDILRQGIFTFDGKANTFSLSF